MASCKTLPDVSVIVPYRNRPLHLQTWTKLVADELPGSAEVVIVEQMDSFAFNRGCLLNIGFRYSSGNRVIFHDVDLVPSSDLKQAYCGPWPAPVVHFGCRFSRYNNTKAYFGGVTGFTRSAFPGFPNCFWGWGGEDDVLYRRTRCRIHRPSHGHYTDLEFLPTVKQKLKSLSAGQKCPNRWELKASDDKARDSHLTIPDEIQFAQSLHKENNLNIIKVTFY